MDSKKIGPDGPLDAELVIVGRDPGGVEMLRGKPFQGPAGSVLDKALRKAALLRAETLVTNVVGVQPPGNIWEKHRAADVEEGVKELYELLGRKKRKLIVALGEQAVHACLGLDPNSQEMQVTEVRGYIFEGPFGPVLASVHPAFVMRQWHPNWALLNYDLSKAGKVVREGRDTISRRATWIRSRAEGDAVVEECLRARRVAVDIETRASGATACVGVAPTGEAGFTFPAEDGFYTEHIREILAGSNRLVFHNGQFDSTILEREGFTLAPWDDTMLMWHVLEPSLAGQRQGEKAKGKKKTEKSLRFLASILTEEPFWKDYAFKNAGERYVLCAKDARVTAQIADELERRLNV